MTTDPRNRQNTEREDGDDFEAENLDHRAPSFDPDAEEEDSFDEDDFDFAEDEDENEEDDLEELPF